jgi:hypothetical protein
LFAGNGQFVPAAFIAVVFDREGHGVSLRLLFVLAGLWAACGVRVVVHSFAVWRLFGEEVRLALFAPMPCQAGRCRRLAH